MDFQKIVSLVQRKYGKGVYDADLCARMKTWWAWYTNNVPEFQTMRISNGLTTPQRKIYTLGMAKRVCEDWASTLLNDSFKITVNSSSSKSSVFIQGSKGEGGVLGSNNFREMMSEAIELMCALGTYASVINLSNTLVDSNGVIVPNKSAKINIDWFDAGHIIPLSFKNRVINEAAFVTEFTVADKTYFLVSAHIKEEDGYVIYNDVLSDSYETVSNFDGVLPMVRTLSSSPFFFIMRTNIVNNVSRRVPMGVSVFGNAIDNLMAIDTVYDSCVRDVVTGQRIVMMNKCLLTTDQQGNPIVPQDVKQSYMQFFGDDAASDIKEYIKEFAPKLNTEDLDKELQNQLNMFSSKCGLGTKYYNFSMSSGVTATEYNGERNDMVRNATKMSSAIAKVVRDMVKKLLEVGHDVLGMPVDKNAKIDVAVSDGFVESDESLREQDRQDVRDGLMSKVEYRVKWYGETEAEAEAKLLKISGQTNYSK